jgi:hypothetical protein
LSSGSFGASRFVGDGFNIFFFMSSKAFGYIEFYARVGLKMFLVLRNYGSIIWEASCSGLINIRECWLILNVDLVFMKSFDVISN